MYCSKCGTLNPDDAERCVGCGEPLGETEGKQPEGAEGKKGLKKIFLILGSIAAFLSVVLMFGLFFVSGLAMQVPMLGKQNIVTALDYFNFSGTGIWKAIFDSLGSGKGAIAGVLSSLLVGVYFIGLLITLIVNLIVALVRFVAAMQGKNYYRLGKTSATTFATFTAVMVLILMIYSQDGVVLNDGALAAIVLAGILNVFNLVMHYLAKGLGSLKLSVLILNLLRLGVILAAAIAVGLVSGPVYKLSGGGGTGFWSLFIGWLEVAVRGGGLVSTKQAIGMMLGVVSTFAIIAMGITLIGQMLASSLAAADDRPQKKAGLARSILLLIFAVALVAGCYVYASGAKLDPTYPIVIAVFAVAGVILSALVRKFSQKD